jgi:hypothetical protein
MQLNFVLNCFKFYFGLGGLPYDLTEGDILCVFSQ